MEERREVTGNAGYASVGTCLLLYKTLVEQNHIYKLQKIIWYSGSKVERIRPVYFELKIK